MMTRLLSALVPVLGLLAPAAAFAQSQSEAKLLGNVGLGRPIQPLDARSRGMGGVAVALHDGNLSLVNPASTANFGIPGAWIAFMPETRNVSGEVAEGEIRTAEFPLVRMVWPFAGVTASAAFGGYLNQDWEVQFVDTLQLSTGPVPFQETRTSEGGVSQFRMDLGRRFSEKLALGLAGQYYFGQTVLKVQRVFAGEASFSPYESTDGIRYQGWGLTLGLEWRLMPEMILGVAGGWNSRLDAEADSSGGKKTFSQPLALDVGASWRMTPDFIFALSAGWASWSTISDEIPRPGASDLWRFAVGTELNALRGESARLQLRLGAHLEQLPFNLRRGPPWERALSIGLGTQFRQGLGRLDVALEFGKRGQKDTNEVDETFTRWTFSLAVFSL